MNKDCDNAEPLHTLQPDGSFRRDEPLTPPEPDPEPWADKMPGEVWLLWVEPLKRWDVYPWYSREEALRSAQCYGSTGRTKYTPVRVFPRPGFDASAADLRAAREEIERFGGEIVTFISQRDAAWDAAGKYRGELASLTLQLNAARAEAANFRGLLDTAEAQADRLLNLLAESENGRHAALAAAGGGLPWAGKLGWVVAGTLLCCLLASWGAS